MLYGNGDYTELEEYGGSGPDTGDEEEESTTGLLSRPISTTIRIDGPHIRIPPKCYIYVNCDDYYWSPLMDAPWRVRGHSIWQRQSQ